MDQAVRIGQAVAGVSFRALGAPWTVSGGMRTSAEPDGVRADVWVESTTLGWNPTAAATGDYDELVDQWFGGIAFGPGASLRRARLLDFLRWGERNSEVSAFLTWVWPKVCTAAGAAMERRFGIGGEETASMEALEAKAWAAMRDAKTGESLVEGFVDELPQALRASARAVLQHAVRMSVLTGYSIGTRETIASFQNTLDTLRNAGRETL